MSAEGDAALVVSLFAVDPAGLGGVCLRSPVQPGRDQWLQFLRESLPPGTPLRKLPFNIPDGRLLGGLDLVATLKANRPIAERGVLADANGGVVIVTMAERLTAQTAGRLNAVLDAGEIVMPREGVTISNPASVGVVALDEGIGPDEGVPVSLLDRLAFLVDLGGFTLRTELIPEYEVEDVMAARALLPRVAITDDTLQALCATAISLGSGSPRVSLLAARAACAAAALEGRTEVSEADAVIAGRLVLAPRATIAPQPRDSAEPPPSPEPPAEPPPPTPPESPPEQAPNDSAEPKQEPQPPPDSNESEQADKPLEIDAQTLADLVLTATEAAIPAGLLARLRSAANERAARPSAAGRTGAFRSAGARGRPSGISAGAPKGSARLNVIETLRAAAPWQGLRGRAATGDARVRVSPEDFRVTRYKQRAQTLTIFAVDASGSSALNRLAEAKGAVELLLADCYVRRDQVAVIGFRGKLAEVLLPPTRSLVRAKRSLAGLPGGGGTPLAAAIDAAAALADLARRRGETPTIVMLTDGRANVARDGSPGRERAHANALQAARGLGALGIASLFVDTSPRPSDLAKAIAAGMRAEYIALPFANARSLSAMVRASTARTSSAPR
jgi:magnesium chelatase subunit D